MLIKVLIVLLLISMAHTEWRWANDTSEFTNDKQAHFVGSFGLYFMFRHKDFSELDSFKYTLYCGLGKEIIDAYVPYEKYGKSGGDGFSKYDLAYDLLGIGVAYSVDKLWDKIWKDKKKKKPFDLTISLYRY